MYKNGWKISDEKYHTHKIVKLFLQMVPLQHADGLDWRKYPEQAALESFASWLAGQWAACWLASQ